MPLLSLFPGSDRGDDRFYPCFRGRPSRTFMIKEKGIFKETILLEDIPDDGLHKTYEDMPGLLDDQDDCKAVAPITGRADLHKIQKGVYLTGMVATTLELKCHRCLAAYETAVSSEFSYMLLTGSTHGLKEQVELKTEDMETSHLDGAEVPLSEYFREQILLQLPMKQLCKEDCKGICPLCGADLNAEKCRCLPREVESPFAVLKRLKIK